jgi:DNA-binding transcriptional ArsR family regulator
VATTKRRKRSRLPQQEAYTLENLEQIKVLADPLRVRVLEAFCEERTTKQVAELLGEKQTKLYHHVDALERVGLIELARTRQNRGTVEKYYLAIARTFRANARVFQAKRGNKEAEALAQMVASIFDTTSAEIASLIDAGEDAQKTMEEEAMVTFLEIRASEKELDAIRRKLKAIVESASTADEGAATSDEADVRPYRLTLAYYPLDMSKRPPHKS